MLLTPALDVRSGRDVIILAADNAFADVGGNMKTNGADKSATPHEI